MKRTQQRINCIRIVLEDCPIGPVVDTPVPLVRSSAKWPGEIRGGIVIQPLPSSSYVTDGKAACKSGEAHTSGAD